MSILNTNDIEKNVDLGVRLSKYEGMERSMLEEFYDGIQQFQGYAVGEDTRNAIMAWWHRFGEHVNCAYCFNNQMQVEIDPAGYIRGKYAYQLPHSVQLKYVEFTLQ